MCKEGPLPSASNQVRAAQARILISLLWMVQGRVSVHTGSSQLDFLV